MPQAFPNSVGEHFTLTPEILDRGIAAAAASSRRRIILPIHRTQGASVQRMLNFFQPGTYVCPHHHPLDGASETVSVLRGALGFLLFDGLGAVTSTHLLRAEENGLIDIEPRVWHGMVALQPGTVILEIKQGPYDQERDKVFADWAPPEGAGEVAAYLAGLESLFRP